MAPKVIFPLNSEILETRDLIGNPVNGNVSLDISEVKTDTSKLTSNVVNYISVPPGVYIPKTHSNMYEALFNIKNAFGNQVDPDYGFAVVKMKNINDEDRSGQLHVGPDEASPAKVAAIFDISQPTLSPQGGDVYTSPNGVRLEVIGLTTNNQLITAANSWGDILPDTGTLTKVSGAGDPTLISDGVNTSWMVAESEDTGHYRTYIDIPAGYPEENLIISFGCLFNGQYCLNSASFNAVNYDSVDDIANGVWDKNASAYNTPDTFGASLLNTQGNAATSSSILQDANVGLPAQKNYLSDSVFGLPVIAQNTSTAISDISNLSGKVGVPHNQSVCQDIADVSTVLGTPSSDIHDICSGLSAIYGATGQPSGGSGTLASQSEDSLSRIGQPSVTLSADIAAVKSDTAEIKTKTNNLPANTTTTLSNLQSAVDVIDGYQDVPSADAVTNTILRDVVGNKTDAKVGTVGTTISLMAYMKAAVSNTAQIRTTTDNLPVNTVAVLGTPVTSLSADILVPTADAATNTVERDVVGNKTDAAVTAVGTTKSVVAYSKGILTQANAIKTKTDNLPANTATEFADLKGSGWTSAANVKSIMDAVLSLENNTAFTASVGAQQMIIPANDATPYQLLVNVYDGIGHMEDPDLNFSLVKVENVAAVSRNANLFTSPSQTGQPTQIVIHDVASAVDPLAFGQEYRTPNNVTLFPIGMIGTTKLVSQWMGFVPPENSNLIRMSGSGPDPIVTTATDSSYVAMTKQATGQYNLFYLVPSTATEESLAFRFGYFEGGLWKAFDRASNTVSPENAATQAGAVWDVSFIEHATDGTFGKVVGSGIDTLITNTANTIGRLDDGTYGLNAIQSNTAPTYSAVGTIQNEVQNATYGLAAIQTILGTPRAESVMTDLESILDQMADPAIGLGAINSNVLSVNTGLIKTDTETIIATLASLASTPKMFWSKISTPNVSESATETVTIGTGQNLTSAYNLIKEIVVTSSTATCKNFTVEVFEDVACTISRLKYTNADITTGGIRLARDLMFVNQDSPVQVKIYIQITNVEDSAATVFDIEVRGDVRRLDLPS